MKPLNKSMFGLHLAKCKKTNYNLYNRFRKNIYKRARRRFFKDIIYKIEINL